MILPSIILPTKRTAETARIYVDLLQMFICMGKRNLQRIQIVLPQIILPFGKVKLPQKPFANALRLCVFAWAFIFGCGFGRAKTYSAKRSQRWFRQNCRQEIISVCGRRAAWRAGRICIDWKHPISCKPERCGFCDRTAHLDGVSTVCSQLPCCPRQVVFVSELWMAISKRGR